MKLCDVVQFYSPLGGGVRRYLEDKNRYLSQLPDSEHLMVIPAEQDFVETNPHSKIMGIRSFRLVGSLSYRMLLNRSKIISIIDQERPDLIEVGDPYRSAWIALEAARRNKIPIAAFYHSDFPRALGRTIRRFCGQTIENILSKEIQRYIVRLYNQMNVTVVAGKRLQTILTECGIQRVVCIPLGTDTSVFSPHPKGQQLRQELGMRDHHQLLLYVGRLAREKNIRSLIGMMEELNKPAESDRRFHLLLVGDGEQRGLIKSAVQQRRDMTWHPFCHSKEQLTKYYSAADLFVHAGTYETFGITSLEAQACGTRVIAVRGGGLDETLIGESPRIMAESAAPHHLAKAVLRAEPDPQEVKEKRRRRIERHFSIQLTFLRLFALYQHILKGNQVEDYCYPDSVYIDDECDYKTVLSS